MAVAVGEIVEGKITGLTNFGAFVELPENKVGMVHISEVSNSFVKEISDFLEKGQTVKVKILKIDDAGKISLSIKQAGEDALPKRDNRPQDRDGDRAPRSGRGGNGRDRKSRPAPKVWNGQKSAYANRADLTFEEKMAKFKQESDDKLTDLKHSTESKHGGFSRRGGNKRYS
ncbi:MAG: S1 RNA-binding domain-containing protein [Clostridia bacterium]|nr:S1 RNA-binding domain-containing protein [Clostridia bacterium]